MRLDNLFRYDNHFACGTRAIHGDSQAAPEVRIALRVGALRVQDRDVRTQRAYGDQFFFADGRGELAQVAIFLQQIAAQRRVGGQKRDAERAGMQRQRHREIRVVHHFQAPRNTALHRAPETIADARRNVADPGGHHARDATRADHLVKENIGDGTDQREVAAALANQFVTSGERNHLFELRAEQHHRAGRHVARDGIAHGEQFGFGRSSHRVQK